ncbi:MAG: hypothetical protein EPO20_02870 [Betaproteobacteria bacterium]|nr:MAG: hypothetical protein EPO20_02870 [Betaproteobacteria bacterium]
MIAGRPQRSTRSRAYSRGSMVRMNGNGRGRSVRPVSSWMSYTTTASSGRPFSRAASLSAAASTAPCGVPSRGGVVP